MLGKGRDCRWYVVLYGLPLIWTLHAVSLQAQSYPISVLTVNNGLASGTVECGLYDSRGFVWLGTREGLHRYDGKNILVYRPDPEDSTAIKSLIVKAIAENRHGHLFMVGDKGFEVFIREENRFQFICPIPGHAALPRQRFFLIDSLDLGVIVEFERSKLQCFSISGLHLIKESDLSSQARNFVQQLWIRTYDLQNPDSIYSLTENRRQFHDTSSELLHIMSAEGFNLWVSSSRQGGFYRFPFGDQRPEWITLKGFREQATDETRLIFMDYNDTLGLAAAEGFDLCLFNKSNGNVLRTWDLRSQSALAKFTTIELLFKDPAGRVWFSLMPYGVFVFDPLSPRFQHLKTGVPDSPLYNGLMRSMICDTEGLLWIGFHDGHMQVFDPDLRKVLYTWDNPQNMLSPGITWLHLSPRGNPVVNGQVEFMKSSGTYVPHRIEGSDDGFVGFPSLTLRVPKYSGYFVFTPQRTELQLMSRSGKTSYPCACTLTYVTDSNDLICVQIDRLRVYHIGDNALDLVHTQAIDFRIKSIYQPPGADRLWMTGDMGLYTFLLDSFEINKIDTRDWPSNYLYGLVPDRHGFYWISSNAGLIRYHPVTGDWRVFDVRDGLQSNEFNTNCFALMKDGSLAFGGPEGLNVFDPDYFVKKSVPFYVSLADIKINEHSLDGFSSYQQNASFSLRPDEKSLEIFFTSTQHFDRDELDYYVQLVGAENDFVNRENRESVRYINLKPREYTFRLKAQNAEGDWSVNTLETKITVLPAFYQTNLFLTLCILSATTLLYGLYLYRISQIRKVLQMRNRISHDLHDDVGSTLGSISVYSAVAKATEGESREEVLDKIGDASREMLEKLNDIVWSINPDNDTMERMEARMRGYAAMVLNPKGITFTLQTSVNGYAGRIDMNARRNLFLIYKEAIYNAAKYAECRNIDITLKEVNGKMHMEITDDGKGFNPDDSRAYNGNGLKSMRERAKSMHASLDVISQPGLGTRIVLKGN